MRLRWGWRDHAKDDLTPLRLKLDAHLHPAFLSRCDTAASQAIRDGGADGSRSARVMFVGCARGFDPMPTFLYQGWGATNGWRGRRWLAAT
jgi:hypothetical protein